jgi:hypothetical protein
MSKTVRDLCSIVAVLAVIVVAACTSRNTSGVPSSGITGASAITSGLHSSHNAAAGDDKGFIDGWYNGETVQLYYTKSFFCAEPPASGADTGCELGADAEIAPRGGPIPVIYAIAAAGGIQPDLSTLACRPGTVCINHPGMIDASRVGGSATGPAVPHSHIITEHQAGWHHTVNIRVRSLASWNQIAEAKSLDKVRELQADPANMVSADTPTNIYFFIASWRK